MNVLYVSDYYPFYGGKVVFELANRLVANGDITTVLSSNAINQSYKTDLPLVKRLRSRQISLKNTSYILYDLRDLKLVKDYLNVDLIHLHFLHGFLPLYFGLLKSLKKIDLPIIATSHGLISGYSSSVVQGAAILLKELSRRLIISNASLITTVSKNEYNHLSNFIQEEKLEFITNGVDSAYFQPRISKRTHFRSQLGLDENDVVILFFAHLRSTKGVLTFLNAFEKLIKFEKKFKFIIAGSGPLSYLVEQMVQKHPNHLITFLGYLPDEQIPCLFNASDIYVLPSYVEGTPLSVLEAMANGKPVIVTNVGDIPFFVENNINGLVIRPGDVDLLVKSIRFLAHNPSLRKKISETNIAKMKEYDWDTIFKKYYELYSNILK